MMELKPLTVLDFEAAHELCSTAEDETLKTNLLAKELVRRAMPTGTTMQDVEALKIANFRELLAQVQKENGIE